MSGGAEFLQKIYGLHKLLYVYSTCNLRFFVGTHIPGKHGETYIAPTQTENM